MSNGTPKNTAPPSQGFHGNVNAVNNGPNMYGSASGSYTQYNPSGSTYWQVGGNAGNNGNSVFGGFGFKW